METKAESRLQALLAVVRLGDADRLGWWRSHSADDTAEYVLGDAFPATWLASGLELAMESARIRHEQLLERSSQVHLFSDYLPFHRQLRDWLIERKLDRDYEPLQWVRDASTDELKSKLPAPASGDRRAGGLYLGTLERSALSDADTAKSAMDQLLGGLAGLGDEFVAPYLDLTG